MRTYDRRQPPPPPRKRQTDTTRRLARITHEHERVERPFDPEAPREHYAKRHHFAVNHHHALRGGLHTNRALLDQFAKIEAESQNRGEADSAYATAEVMEAALSFDEALANALDEVVRQIPPAGGATADDLWDADAPYLVFMTLRDEGIGIWPGNNDDWDSFYDEGEIRLVQDLLTKRLHQFADRTGGGSLNEAIANAAYETTGGEYYESPMDALRARQEANPRGSKRVREAALAALAGEPEPGYDEDAANELHLFLDNDTRFSPDSPTGFGRAIAKNMLRKFKSGKYSPDLAVKGWLNLVDTAAKAYAVDHGGIWFKLFTPATRYGLAREMARDFEREVADGEWEGRF